MLSTALVIVILSVFMLSVLMLSVFMLSSSSSVVTSSALHSYSKRRFSGPLVSLSLRQWEAVICFLREWSELSLDSFSGMVFYPPSHPPTREGNWFHCSEYLS